MPKDRLHLLYLTAEQWPTFRQDIVALFGKYLPRYGITCDLVTERDSNAKKGAEMSWGGGQAILCNVPRNRAGQYLSKFWHNFYTLITVDIRKYDAIQVRDMSVTALLGLLVARIKGIPFYYWLSYPQSEGQIDRAKARGIKGGMRFWFPLIQGLFGKWLVYKIVLPRADHVYVQSSQMVEDIAAYGIDKTKMTPVPMGVDLEVFQTNEIVSSKDERLEGKRIAVYLGTLDRVRHIDILFKMLAIAKITYPELILVLVGDTEDGKHRQWLKEQAYSLGVDKEVLWTGWLPTVAAWRYVCAAEVGLSPFPRSYLLDSASPTKAVEYMAIGLPVIVNDNPDQAQVVTASGAGLCVPLNGEDFAAALLELMINPDRRAEMGAKGREYVAQNRGYDCIAMSVAKSYFLAQIIFNSEISTRQ